MFNFMSEIAANNSKSLSEPRTRFRVARLLLLAVAACCYRCHRCPGQPTSHQSDSEWSGRHIDAMITGKAKGPPGHAGPSQHKRQFNGWFNGTGHPTNKSYTIFLGNIIRKMERQGSRAYILTLS